MNFWEDQDFHRLSPEDKHKLLLEQDADYQKMSLADQYKLVGLQMTPTSQPQPKQSFMPSLGDVLGQAGMGAEYPMTYGNMPTEDVKAGMNQSREYAPGALMTVGNITGSTIPIPGAPTFLGGLGYAGGEAIREGEIPTLDKFAQNAGKGFAYNLAGAGMQKATGAVLGGVREGLNNIAGVASELPWSPQISTARKLAEKGLPIAASYINPTDEAIALAARARGGYPGNQTVNKVHQELRVGSQKMLDDFIKLRGVNEVSQGSVDNAFENWVGAMGGSNAPVNLPDAVAYATKKLDEGIFKNKFWQEDAANFVKNPTVQGIRNLWQSMKGASKSDKGARIELYNIIEKGIKDQYGDDAAALLQFARNDNAWLKRMGVLKGVINGSMIKNEAQNTRVFSPSEFSRLWEQKRNLPTTFKNFTKQELSEIDDFASQMGVIGNELGQPVSDEGLLGFLGKLGALGGGGQFISQMTGIPGFALAAAPKVVGAGLSAHGARAAFNPNSLLYQNTIGNMGPVSEALPGLVNIGGKLILLKGSKAWEELNK